MNSVQLCKAYFALLKTDFNPIICYEHCWFENSPVAGKSRNRHENNNLKNQSRFLIVTNNLLPITWFAVFNRPTDRARFTTLLKEVEMVELQIPTPASVDVPKPGVITGEDAWMMFSRVSFY